MLNICAKFDENRISSFQENNNDCKEGTDKQTNEPAKEPANKQTLKGSK